MKVLIASAPFPQSSEEIRSSFVYQEAIKISERNVEVHVARGLGSIWEKRRDLILDNVNIHNFSRKIDVSLLTFSLKGSVEFPITALVHPDTVARLLPSAWFISKLARVHQVDLIHAHFAYPDGFAAFLARKTLERPLIVTLHGVDILTEPSLKYGIRLKNYYDIIVRKVLAHADKVIVASNYVYREAISAGCDKERLVYLPNGIDLQRFNTHIDGSFVKKRLGITNRPIIFTLRAHEAKNGIEYLIKAVPLVLKEMPEAIFIIGGDGPLRVYHELLAKRLGILKSIFFVWRIPQKQLPFYYAACDVFVIPSIIEAFGLVTGEALASGKPVIGTNVGGIPDIVADGINGILVRPRNPQEIAKQIIVLLQNPELRKEMGIKGRRIMEEKFDIKKRIDRILSIYSELLN